MNVSANFVGGNHSPAVDGLDEVFGPIGDLVEILTTPSAGRI